MSSVWVFCFHCHCPGDDKNLKWSVFSEAKDFGRFPKRFLYRAHIDFSKDFPIGGWANIRIVYLMLDSICRIMSSEKYKGNVGLLIGVWSCSCSYTAFDLKYHCVRVIWVQHLGKYRAWVEPPWMYKVCDFTEGIEVTSGVNSVLYGAITGGLLVASSQHEAAKASEWCC